MEAGGDGLGDELLDAAGLLAAGFDDSQQHFHEPAPCGALSAEGKFPPVHRVTQGAFGRVVGRLGGLARGCCELGGSEEFREVLFSRASNSAILASNICTNARTAGVISASIAAGIVIEAL